MCKSQGKFSRYFPTLGKVEIELSNRPLEFYKFLKKKKVLESRGL